MSGADVEAAPSPEQVLAIRRSLHQRSSGFVVAGDAASPGTAAGFITAGLAAKVMRNNLKNKCQS